MLRIHLATDTHSPRPDLGRGTGTNEACFPICEMDRKSPAVHHNNPPGLFSSPGGPHIPLSSFGVPSFLPPSTHALSSAPDWQPGPDTVLFSPCSPDLVPPVWCLKKPQLRVLLSAISGGTRWFRGPSVHFSEEPAMSSQGAWHKAACLSGPLIAIPADKGLQGALVYGPCFQRFSI